jgi:hypothetical protein
MASSDPRRHPAAANAWRRAAGSTARTLGLAGLLFVCGCAGSSPRPTSVVETPDPAASVSVADVLARLSIDDRVFMAEHHAPATLEQREAVLRFFDAFVRGRAAEVRSMLGEDDRGVLDRMVASGTFAALSESIEEVELVAGSRPDGRPAVLGMYVRDGRDEFQLWYYDLDGGLARFEAAPTPPHMVRRLTGPIADYVTKWHEILDEEAGRAGRPEDDGDRRRWGRPDPVPDPGVIRRIQPPRRRPPPDIPH